MVICDVIGKVSDMFWYQEIELFDGIGLIVVLGGFSYGDYLCSGAMVVWLFIMCVIVDVVGCGVFVLGICNGF